MFPLTRLRWRTLYYFDKLTADVYEGNITHDAFNYISYINYNAIILFNNVSNHKESN